MTDRSVPTIPIQFEAQQDRIVVYYDRYFKELTLPEAENLFFELELAVAQARAFKTRSKT